MSATLSLAEGASLVALARAAIEERLFGAGVLAEVRAAIEITEAMTAPRGCFVTLKTPDPSGRLALRGCIGSIEARLPAHEAVVESALLAAFDDPRFAPLRREEYVSVALAVSALTPMEPVPSAEAIVAGRHGVLLEAAGRRAVFLPEVAAEQGWTTVEMLEHLARKAGLRPEAHREARLFVFLSERFGEENGPTDRIRRS
jgi:AmmeMemoRadiSam system protein A